MRSQVVHMGSSSNKVMRMRSVQGITLLLELRMRIIDLEEPFWEFAKN